MQQRGREKEEEEGIRRGRPRSLNYFLFLVWGNNRQLGGRLGRANFSLFWYLTLPLLQMKKPREESDSPNWEEKVLIKLFQM